MDDRLTSLSAFSPRERERYHRHFILPEVGEEGQRRLKRASVVIVGLGGLGSPCAYYLSSAGVGRIGLVDFDVVDRTNLHRQILHFDTDVGKPKVQSAREKLSALNPDIELEVHPVRLTRENAFEVLRSYDVVVDGTDNFATRYLVNDACFFLGKPHVHGSIFRFEGRVSVFLPEKGPCYRCLYPEPPPPGEVPSCAEAGVLGVLPGIVGALQAMEVLKLITGIGEPLVGCLLCVNTLEMDFKKYVFPRDPRCALCGEQRSIRELQDYDEVCSGAGEVVEGVVQISVRELAEKQARGDDFILLDVREPEELSVSCLPGSLHVPMDQVPERLAELPREREILVLCRTGNRSQRVAKLLLSQGFRNVKNVAGGINAYAQQIDPRLRTY